MNEKTLDEQLGKIIAQYEDIGKHIQKYPELKDKLRATYESLYHENRWAMRGAKFIDYMDAVLGPIEALLRIPGPGPNYAASLGLRALEEAIKIPYAIYYTKETGDKDAWKGWAVSEAAATVAPFGDFIDVLPIYTMRAKKYLRGVAAESFRKQYMGKTAEVVDLAAEREKRQKRMVHLDDLVKQAA